MKNSGEASRKTNPLVNISTFIVDKRNLFFLLFAIAVIFSLFSRNWVTVENDITSFLPDASETKIALDIMNDEFTTFGSASVMVSNITYRDAYDLSEKLRDIEGVSDVVFDDTTAHYTNASALFSVTFDADERDESCVESLEKVKAELQDYDTYVTTSLGNSTADIISNEMTVIIAIVAAVVLLVLLLTSETYAEVPVFIITFLVSAALSSGTNFIFGTISFVSNSVTSVLQLALSLDYAIIFCNHYKEERKTLALREADIAALSKSIPEIFASSLTTIGGLAALIFMQFKIGPDMGIVLIKAVMLSLLTVFTLMPGLIILFSGLMDKTKHKKLVPNIPFVGKFAYKTRFVIPVIFLAVLIAAAAVSQNCPYVYGYSTLSTPKTNSVQLADNMIKENFGSDNMIAMVVPKSSYKNEAALVRELESTSEVNSVTAISSAEALGGYSLGDGLTPRMFSEMCDLDYEATKILYAAYAVNDENYSKLAGGLDSYEVPLVDMFMFMYDEAESGYVTLDADLMSTLEDAYSKMSDARLQLEGDEHNRLLVFTNLAQESDETLAFIDTLHAVGEKYYGEPVYLAGDSISQNDLRITYEKDNIVVSVVSVIVVLVVLLFTFKSAGMPILLILIIQGSIWINFAIPTLRGTNIFFMSYLIVSSIQMGANIDYAIVISSRFNESKKTMSKKDAIIDTMNFAFPTILTSGTVLALAGTLIGKMTSEPTIVGIGECLGRGTIISIVLVMFALPQILLLGDKIIERTSFVLEKPIKNIKSAGHVRLDGVVSGEIDGKINGIVHAYVDGDVNVSMIAGHIPDSEKSKREREHEE